MFVCVFFKMKSYAQYYILQFSHIHFSIVNFLLNHIPLSEHATDYHIHGDGNQSCFQNLKILNKIVECMQGCV